MMFPKGTNKSLWIKKNNNINRYNNNKTNSINGLITLPTTGRSTLPHESAPQWMNPESRSAINIPRTAK